MILLSGCSEKTSHASQINTILSANAYFQNEQLYAQATLSPLFINQLRQMLKHGEPLLALYQFRLIRLHPWLPNTRILEHDIRRHIRMRLITERYELLDPQTGLIHYTTNEHEVMQFFANPKFILLHHRVKLLPDVRYQLETDLSITHEGISRMFQFLDRWFSLTHPLNFSHLSELPNNTRPIPP